MKDYEKNYGKLRQFVSSNKINLQFVFPKKQAARKKI